MADKEIAFRQPPGDRWKVEGSDVLFTSLTDYLIQFIYNTRYQIFTLIKKGVIMIDDG